MRVTRTYLKEQEITMDCCTDSGTMLYEAIRMPLKNDKNQQATVDDTIVNIRITREALADILSFINHGLTSQPFLKP